MLLHFIFYGPNFALYLWECLWWNSKGSSYAFIVLGCPSRLGLQFESWHLATFQLKFLKNGVVLHPGQVPRSSILRYLQKWEKNVFFFLCLPFSCYASSSNSTSQLTSTLLLLRLYNLEPFELMSYPTTTYLTFDWQV